MDPRVSLACAACGVCADVARLSVCAACNVHAYCGKECQKAHYPHHKYICQAATEVLGPRRLVPNTKRQEKLRPRSRELFKASMERSVKTLSRLQREFVDRDALQERLDKIRLSEQPESVRKSQHYALLLGTAENNARLVAQMNAVAATALRETLLVATQATLNQIGYIDRHLTLHGNAVQQVVGAWMPDSTVPPDVYDRMARHSNAAWDIIYNLTGAARPTQDEIETNDVEYLLDQHGQTMSDLLHLDSMYGPGASLSSPTPVERQIRSIQPVGGWIDDTLRKHAYGPATRGLEALIKCLASRLEPSQGDRPDFDAYMGSIPAYMSDQTAETRDANYGKFLNVLDKMRAESTRYISLAGMTKLFARLKYLVENYADTTSGTFGRKQTRPPRAARGPSSRRAASGKQELETEEGTGIPTYAVNLGYLLVVSALMVFTGAAFSAIYQDRRMVKAVSLGAVNSANQTVTNTRGLYQSAIDHSAIVATALQKTEEGRVALLSHMMGKDFGKTLEIAIQKRAAAGNPETLVSQEGIEQDINPETYADVLSEIVAKNLSGRTKEILGNINQLAKSVQGKTLGAVNVPLLAGGTAISGGAPVVSQSDVTMVEADLTAMSIIHAGDEIISGAIDYLKTQSDEYAKIQAGSLQEILKTWKSDQETDPEKLVWIFSTKIRRSLEGVLKSSGATAAMGLKEWYLLASTEEKREIAGILQTEQALIAQEAALIRVQNIAHAEMGSAWRLLTNATDFYNQQRAQREAIPQNPVEWFFTVLSKLPGVTLATSKLFYTFIHSETTGVADTVDQMLRTLFPVFDLSSGGALSSLGGFLTSLSASFLNLLLLLQLVAFTLEFVFPAFIAILRFFSFLIDWATKKCATASKAELNRYVRYVHSRDWSTTGVPATALYLVAFFSTFFSKRRPAQLAQLWRGFALGILPKFLSVISLIMVGINVVTGFFVPTKDRIPAVLGLIYNVMFFGSYVLSPVFSLSPCKKLALDVALSTGSLLAMQAQFKYLLRSQYRFLSTLYENIPTKREILAFFLGAGYGAAAAGDPWAIARIALGVLPALGTAFLAVYKIFQPPSDTDRFIKQLAERKLKKDEEKRKRERERLLRDFADF